jgi:hypothetical protein
MVNPPEKPPKMLTAAALKRAQAQWEVTFPGRFAELLDQFPTRKAASEVAGVNPDQLARYIRGASHPPFEIVANLAGAAGYSLDWVWYGAGSKRVGGDAEDHTSALVAVPIFEVRAGAGAEQYAGDEAPISSLSLPRTFLTINGIRPAHAKLMFCIGDSMEPTIRDGAPMVVDTSDLGERDDVYVLRRGNGITVKRLQRLADGSVVLKSDNPAYEPDRLPRDEADELKVLGRVGLVLQAI